MRCTGKEIGEHKPGVHTEGMYEENGKAVILCPFLHILGATISARVLAKAKSHPRNCRHIGFL